MSRKASGVYFYLTDKSSHANGTASFVACVVGVSKKGSMDELIDVTAKNLDDALGYDPAYSPELYGLSILLETVASVKFLRINHDPKIDNAYLLTTAEAFATSVASRPEDLATLENLAFLFAHSTPGSWGAYYGKIANRNTEVRVTSTTERTIGTGKTIASGGAWSASHIYSLGKFLDTDGNIIAGLYSGEDTLSGTLTIKAIASDGTVGNAIGTYTVDATNGDKIHITSETHIPSIYSYQDAGYKDFKISYGHLNSEGVIEVDATYDISSDASSEYYYKNQDLGDVYLAGSFVFTAAQRSALFDTWFAISSGSNGTDPVASDLNLDRLTDSGVNVLALNGIQDQNIINTILKKCNTSLISAFVDIPPFSTYAESQAWRRSLFATQYGAAVAVPDVVDDDTYGALYLWPSLNMIYIFASMMTAYGHVNFPPAGHKYGAIAATSLISTDFADHADDLVNAHINYQKVDNRGACVWEERTLYADDNSDLSYIYTVFILRDLRAQLLDVMAPYSFQFTTAVDLLNIEANLKTIFDNFVNNGFLSQYEVMVPSFAEAQKMGKVVDIPMTCSVTQDGEVYNLRLTLQNYQA